MTEIAIYSIVGISLATLWRFILSPVLRGIWSTLGPAIRKEWNRKR